ncbi:Hsp70 family protein [bacterium]|nr:Hsp70 family protein [bacterium]
MKYALGIDLGTTNSVVAVYHRGQIETIHIESHNTFPSVVSFKDKDTMLVGHSAKRRVILDPEHSVSSVKRFMGNRKKKFEIFGNVYTPVDISAFILKEMVAHAEKKLGCEVRDVVITVPAYFNNNQKADTLAAGKKAGLNVLELIPEPTAAAIAYGLDKGKDQTLMVYDLGGGTFDVSVLKVEGNKFRVIAVDGDSQLGGDDFDLAIVQYLINQFHKKTGKDLAGENDREARIVKQKIKEAAEKAKIELSQAQSTEILIPEVMGTSINEELTRDQYNGLIQSYLDTTIEKIRSVLKEAGLTPDSIDRVILVGGSSYNTAVKEIVTREIKDPFISDRVDEEVARGAAVLAAALSMPEEDLVPIEVENVTAHSLGLRVTRGREVDRFKELIHRQTPIPVTVAEQFTTFRDNQKSVEVYVFQGEEETCSKNIFIGGFLLEGIPPQPAGKPKVRVRFEMDKSDMLQVSASCEDISGHVELNINQASEEQMSQARSECIVLLIDLSYSMDGWKLQTTKQAIELFLKIKSKHQDVYDFIGCVGFHSTARIISNPVKDFTSLEKTVKGLKTAGTTNMGDGLIRAMECLEKKEDPNMPDRIILLSDGEPDSESEVRKQLKVLAGRNIRVDTVGAGTDYNRALLREIAQKTGGQFEAAENIEALMDAFTNLAEL